MRPKKRIIVASGSAKTRSILRVVLEARGHALYSSGVFVDLPRNEEDFWRLVAKADAYVLVGFSARQAAEIESRSYREYPLCGHVAIRKRGEIGEAVWIADLLSDLRIAIQRKRGPLSAPERKAA